MSVLIETTLGDLIFDLYTEKRPKSCLNFLKLCKIKYYNYCLFHSVRRNFIAQSGDPSGTGRGGESVYTSLYGDQAKYFQLELKPRIKHRTKGTISFVNNGNDMHGSQFFITLGDGLDFLDGKHTVFGQLAEGLDTLEKLNETICDDNHKPYQDVRITHTIILHDPYDDPKGLYIPDRSPEPTKEQLQSGRIGADEDIDDKGKSKEELQRQLDDKELKIGTKILETVGDIDDADLKPPENVLFVCKLNPVTNADDLKIIFSRFGKIQSCEIIKDHKTEESLCYGFVEFKEVTACEKAYFKMQNVLIDDRRIHVDFCQSVAKLKKWHKSSLYKKALDERKSQLGYEMKEKGNKKQEKYSMLFEEDSLSSAKKKKKRDDHTKTEKEHVKKKYEESESEDEYNRNKRKKQKNLVKESRKGRKSSSSSSESEAEIPKEKQKMKKRYDSDEDQYRSKKREKNRKRAQSEESSDDQEAERKKQQKKKYEERDSQKKPSKQARKQHDSYSEDSDHEKRQSAKKQPRKKSKYSASDSDDLKKIPVKSSKKEKTSSRRRRDSSSDREEEFLREEKRRSTNRKSREEVKKRKKSVEDSDTEEYTEVKKSAKKKKKYDDHSSDESTDADRRRSTKVARRKYSSSEDDHDKRTTVRKRSTSKKRRRRHDASDSSYSSD